MAARETNTGKGSYIGKVGNAGNQVVEAPITPGPKVKHGQVKTGTDLRAKGGRN